MQLRVARLCLDCEEIDTDQHCPVCASEVFAYLSRRVPSPEQKAKPRAVEPSRTPGRGTMIGYGVAGLGLMGIGRWLATGRKRIEEAALRKDVGELK